MRTRILLPIPWARGFSNAPKEQEVFLFTLTRKVTAMEFPEVTPAEGTENTPLAPPKEDAPEEQKVPEEPKTPEKEPKEEDEAVDLDWITKNEDGEFVIKTENSVYKGKTRKEVLDNFHTGASSNDKYVKELKAKDKIKLPDSVKRGAPEDEEPVPRTEAEVFQEVAPKILRQYRVDQKKLGWTDVDWRNYARERDEAGELVRESFEVSEERAQIREARKEIDKHVAATLDREYQQVSNAEVINEEHEQVVKAIAEYGLPEDIVDKEFDYEGVLASVMGNKDNYNRLGVLRKGVILNEVHRTLRRIEKKQAETPLQRKLREDAEKAKAKKANIPSPGSGAKFNQKPKAYESFDDAAEAAKKEYA